MPYEFLSTKREGSVEHLTLNRPEVRNALNDRVIAELGDWAAHLSNSPPRVVVIGGAGTAFCAGADAEWMAQTVGYSDVDNLRDATALASLFRTLDELPVPLVGRVHGAAFGGGAGLIAICDMVAADQNTVFAFSEVKLGIIPATISPYVLRKIGVSAARELFLSGMRFPAARAKEIGLVHTVTHAGDLDAAVHSYVRDSLSAGPEAVRTIKALLRDLPGRSPDDVAALTAEAIAQRRVSAEGQEGLRAFIQKRTPSWSK
jgi:methylglutaconyl-CoA hydratase